MFRKTIVWNKWYLEQLWFSGRVIIEKQLLFRTTSTLRTTIYVKNNSSLEQAKITIIQEQLSFKNNHHSAFQKIFHEICFTLSRFTKIEVEVTSAYDRVLELSSLLEYFEEFDLVNQT